MRELSHELVYDTLLFRYGSTENDIREASDFVHLLKTLENMAEDQIVIRGRELLPTHIGWTATIVGEEQLGVINDVPTKEQRNKWDMPLGFPIVADGVLVQIKYDQILLLTPPVTVIKDARIESINLVKDPPHPSWKITHVEKGSNDA